jgi:hypothetical protein
MFVNDETNETFYTPYEASAIVNAWLAQKGVEKTVAPQMLYNYTRIRDGKAATIPSHEKNGKRHVSLTDLSTWFVAYYDKNVLGHKSVANLDVPASPLA